MLIPIVDNNGIVEDDRLEGVDEGGPDEFEVDDIDDDKPDKDGGNDDADVDDKADDEDNRDPRGNNGVGSGSKGGLSGGFRCPELFWGEEPGLNGRPDSRNKKIKNKKIKKH